eukprot:14665718-Alexandrium_andersonii.AAC.1
MRNVVTTLALAGMSPQLLWYVLRWVQTVGPAVLPRPAPASPVPPSQRGPVEAPGGDGGHDHPHPQLPQEAERHVAVIQVPEKWLW